MKSMLILTDFSEAAFRAAEYACELADTLHIERIILYHAYQTITADEDLPAVTTINNDQQIYLKSMEALGMLHDRIKPIVKDISTIDLVAEDTALMSLDDLIDQRNKKEEIDLIVMGTSGKSGLERFLAGSTTSKILRTGKWPVLIVPEQTLPGRVIETIVLTSDLEHKGSVPSHQLYDFLDALPGNLQVVNVGRKAGENYSQEKEEAIAELHELLEKYDPAFHYVAGDHIVEEILAFAEGRHASLIIAVRHKHGFLSRLFHESITKKLAYNFKIPLLSLAGLK
jgi:nucleotide-binding universal stress UspA family protein